MDIEYKLLLKEYREFVDNVGSCSQCTHWDGRYCRKSATVARGVEPTSYCDDFKRYDNAD